MPEVNGISESVGTMLADVIGWVFCMALLAAVYQSGYWLAQYFGGSAHRDSFGLLSALTLIWIYEHRRADERWARLLAERDR